MKKLILSGSALLLLMTITAFVITGPIHAEQKMATAAAAIPPQTCESPFNRRAERPGESQQLANDPLVVNLETTERLNKNALIEAAETGDKSLVPYMEFNADVRGGWDALIALIKLGDTGRFDKLVNLTRCVEGKFDGDDDTRQRQAIEILAKLKTPAAYRALDSLLDDITVPVIGGDMLLSSRSELVVSALSQTVSPLPAGLSFPDGKAKSDEERRIIWKQWLKTNNLVP